jgi:threonine/homoserine/homoserine lactone efflux protein
MTAALMLAYAGFAFVTSITPGPNNTMLLASGLNYGFRRTVPHIAGISLGCVAMLGLVSLGLGAVFEAVPVVYTALRYVGAAYLLWLAWKIARSGPMAECEVGGRAQGGGRPMTFWQAAAFQWVNPKAWILVVGAVSTYAPRDGFALNVAVLAVLLGLVNAPSVSVWAGFGVMLRPWLTDPRRVRVFNVAMAALLVLSLLPILEG